MATRSSLGQANGGLRLRIVTVDPDLHTEIDRIVAEVTPAIASRAVRKFASSRTSSPSRLGATRRSRSNDLVNARTGCHDRCTRGLTAWDTRHIGLRPPTAFQCDETTGSRDHYEPTPCSQDRDARTEAESRRTTPTVIMATWYHPEVDRKSGLLIRLDCATTSHRLQKSLLWVSFRR